MTTSTHGAGDSPDRSEGAPKRRLFDVEVSVDRFELSVKCDDGTWAKITYSANEQ